MAPRPFTGARWLAKSFKVLPELKTLHLESCDIACEVRASNCSQRLCARTAVVNHSNQVRAAEPDLLVPVMMPCALRASCPCFFGPAASSICWSFVHAVASLWASLLCLKLFLVFRAFALTPRFRFRCLAFRSEQQDCSGGGPDAREALDEAARASLPHGAEHWPLSPPTYNGELCYIMGARAKTSQPYMCDLVSSYRSYGCMAARQIRCQRPALPSIMRALQLARNRIAAPDAKSIVEAVLEGGEDCPLQTLNLAGRPLNSMQRPPDQ
eukprot:6201322-Pleurochrysis_carterae.AAC.2